METFLERLEINCSESFVAFTAYQSSINIWKLSDRDLKSFAGYRHHEADWRRSGSGNGWRKG